MSGIVDLIFSKPPQGEYDPNFQAYTLDEAYLDAGLDFGSFQGWANALFVWVNLPNCCSLKKLKHVKPFQPCA